MSRVRAWAFKAYMAVATIFIGLIALPTLANRSAAVWLSKLWARTILMGLRGIGGIRMAVGETERAGPGPAIIAAKHQSMWETLALNILLPRPAYVLKRELKNFPIFGWWTSACGFIYVDRRAGASALKKMVSDAEAAIENGTSHIVIFPEGTRVRPGETGRYQPGVAALAKALNLPVVPVGHNAGSYWRHHDDTLVPGTINLEFGEPISPESPRAEMMRQIQDAIEYQTRTLEARGGNPKNTSTPAMEPNA